MLDLLIKRGKIADGTGAPAFIGDIGIKAGRIVRVSREEIAEEAREVIRAQGLWVTPGFIDIHRHGDLTPFTEASEGEELRQGITTFINGNCGFSVTPSSEPYFELLKAYNQPITGTIPDAFKGLSQGEFLKKAAEGRLFSNEGYLVGNGTLRIAVKGFDASPLTAAEMAQVKGLLKESLEAGALGLSLGLMYVPENFYSFEELAQICQVAAHMGKPVTAHIRGEGSSLLESVKEIIALARACKGSFEISHLKAAGKKNWHVVMEQVLELIGAAKMEGLDVSYDVYPYCAGSTAMYTLLPPRLMEGGMEETLKRLRDPEIRKRLQAELREEQEDWDNLIASTGWERVVLVGGSKAEYIGRTVEEIAGEREISPEECMMDLMLENKGDLPIVFHSMCREDMEAILKASDSIVISDALYSEGGIPHPRRYGSFARFVHTYKDSMGIEAVIRKITWNPAKRMGLWDRGRILEGMKADLVILDLERFRDRATYEAPVQYPEGIRLAVVGGKAAYKEDEGIKGCYGELICR